MSTKVSQCDIKVLQPMRAGKTSIKNVAANEIP